MDNFYAIFQTNWGFFGLAGTGDSLIKTVLPCPDKSMAKGFILEQTQHFQYEKDYFLPVQERIRHYFEGGLENFGDVAVDLGELSIFSQKALAAVRNVNIRQTSTYADIAKKINHPKAYRAAANAIASNPLPLIIPCHRIIRSDGHLGGFSCPVGGTKTKAKLLEHEKQIGKF